MKLLFQGRARGHEIIFFRAGPEGMQLLFRGRVRGHEPFVSGQGQRVH
jgi:hypothetical protein